jgi:pimeloyl-ACP methyl ester carboxylesterase
MMTKQAAIGVAIASLGLAFGPLGCAIEVGDEAELEELESSGFEGDPVIFMHGCTPPILFTDEQSAHDFDDMVAYFAARGYPADHLVLFQNQGAQCQSIASFSAQLDALIDETLEATQKSQVDIVAHSMGGIAVRYYFHQHGTAKVRDFVSLGGVQHGTLGGIFAPHALAWQDVFGGYPAYEGIHELFPPYACQGQSYGAGGGLGAPTIDVQFAVNGCLTLLGRTVFRDETPGAVRYVSVRNTLDEIVVPASVACLDMARQGDCSSPVNKAVTVLAGVHPGPCATGCPAHLMMLFDANVIARSYNFVRGLAW